MINLQVEINSYYELLSIKHYASMHSLFHDLYGGNSTVILENKWDQSRVVYATSKQSIASILPNETSDFGRYV